MTDQQIKEFPSDHPGLLVEVPSEHMDSFNNGARVVLVPVWSSDNANSERAWWAVGFAKNQHEAFLMLYEHAKGISAVREYDVLYSQSNSSSVKGTAFIPY